MICLLRPVSQAAVYIICFPRIVVVTYLHERRYSFHLTHYDIVLFKVKHCPLFIQIGHSQLTNLSLLVLFCVPPVWYDVRLSHISRDYLLTYIYIDSLTVTDLKDYLPFRLSSVCCWRSWPICCTILRSNLERTAAVDCTRPWLQTTTNTHRSNIHNRLGISRTLAQ